MSSKYLWTALVAGTVCAAAARAQAPTPAPPADPLFVVGNVAPLPTLGGRIDIIRSEGGVPGPVVKGKPYGARSITESTQTLSDGNRITQRNEAAIYRDTEGRSRREQTIQGVGPWQAEQPVTMINIHDPVAGNTYVLDQAAKTAREIRPFQMAIAHAQGAEVRALYEPGGAAVPAPLAPATGVTMIQRSAGQEEVQVFTRAIGAGIAVAPPFPEGTTGAYEPAEDLGEQVLEGLLVQGTRMTDTIPAGTIGNERSIDIVTERWYSNDIGAVVLQRFSDPRFGETTYRLVNVVLGEPSPDLFQVPQGFEVTTPEAPRPGVRVVPGTAAEE